MKRVRKIFIILLSSTVLLTTTPSLNTSYSTTMTVEAHSGRTDSRGGHKDNKNKSGLGSYHYHCGGHPAHLHPNGVCPYSKTPTTSSKSNSSSKSSSSSTSSSSSQQSTKQSSYSDYEKYLLNKYANAINEYYSKANIYPDEVIKITLAYLKMDGVTKDFLAATWFTPEERADLYPFKNSVQSDIFGKIGSIRLLDAFNAQYQAQLQAQQQAQLQAQQLQQEQTTEDAFLYSLVTQLQTQLTTLGFYAGAIDGIFDIETQQSLINFQTAYGLTVDGTINQEVVTVLGITV